MRTSMLFGAVAAILTVASQSGQAESLKLGHGLSPASHMGAAAAAFADSLTNETDGRFAVEIFPSFSLGDERQMVEGSIIGNIDLVITSTGPLGGFVPDFLALDLPFVFEDYAHARSVLDGPIGQSLLDLCEPRGFVCLAWSENGFRHLTNNVRPLTTPEDVRGLKIRTMENDVHMRSFQAMGALPTPISGAEIYSALQQNTVDGQENPLGNIGNMNLQQVQKYLTLTGHFYSPAVVIVSGDVWTGLDDTDRQAFRTAAQRAAAAARAKVDEQDAQWLGDLQAAGMEVVELSAEQRQAFVAAVEPVHAAFDDSKGVLEQIRATR